MFKDKMVYNAVLLQLRGKTKELEDEIERLEIEHKQLIKSIPEVDALMMMAVSDESEKVILNKQKIDSLKAELKGRLEREKEFRDLIHIWASNSEDISLLDYLEREIERLDKENGNKKTTFKNLIHSFIMSLCLC